MDIKKDTIKYDEFEVLDDDNNPVIGLTDGNFTRKLYDPDKSEVSGTISVTISEIGNGLYNVSFTPNKLGNWVLVVYHSTYFPWGKGDNYKCVEYVMDDAIVLLKRSLGLSHENFRVFNPILNAAGELTEGKVRIYPSATDCNNDTNNIGEYKATATYDITGKIITGYKTIKI